jgi:outer membrane protein
MFRRIALVSMLLAAGHAGAQTATELERTPWRFSVIPEQWRPGIPDSPALAIPDHITRDDEVQGATLKDVIALALENNPGIGAHRLEPLRQEQQILLNQSQFDPTLAAEAGESSSHTPNASSLTGTREQVIDDRYANFHLLKTFRSGTTATIDFLNDRLDNNARFSQLRPQYQTQLNLSVTQPLLRSFGWDFTYLVVRVAEQTAEAAFYTYKGQLADFVEQVIEAYWNVVGNREQVAVARESKALADRTVEENQARVRVGLFAPVSVLEAQADAASRQEQVLIAENNYAVARQQLAQLVFYRPAGTFVPRTLEPIDAPEREDVAVDIDQSLANAMSARPEIEASARDVKVQLLNEKIAGNALLPRLDLVGSYGLNGLSGRNQPLTQGGVIYSPTVLAGHRCTPHPSGIGFLCSFSSALPASAFAGPAREAYDRLDDFRSYSFGVQFQMPLSNAAARSQFASTRISRAQAELNHRELLSNVTLEVRQTVANVESTRQRLDTTRVARELAVENLRNQEKRHEVGMATTKDLLDFQTRLTTARAAEVQANVDHAIALARWRRAEGALLERYQVVFEGPGKRSVPWFAMF